jgi:probable rRNA maturation factor
MQVARGALPDGGASDTPMIEIINRQRGQRISSKAWSDFAQRALHAIERPQLSATVVFVSDSAIKKLNQQFRGQNHATDVLSFPTRPEEFETENQSHLGEVVISLQRAAAQAKENGLTFRNEVQQLILHGLLHLCGYDHATDSGKMSRLELKLRKKLEI